MPEPSQQKRFEDLMGLLLDGEIREDELAELTVLVKEEPAFTRELQQQLLMDSGLSQYENASKSEQAFLAALEERMEAETDGEAFAQRVVKRATKHRHGFELQLAWGAMVTACALIVGVVLALFNAPEDPSLERGVAVASGISGEVKFQGRSVEVGEAIGAGTLKLDSGLVELEFYRGARVTIAGPAELELVSSSKAICHSGKIRAYVPVVARGFTILTPESEVVDLGTEFSLEVTPSGATEVHVMDGEVEVYEGRQRAGAPKLITADKAMRIQGTGSWEAIPPAFERFEDLDDVDQLREDEQQRRANRWKEQHAELQQDPRVLAYYDFEPHDKRKRALANRSLEGAKLDGAIVGARWSQGPWPGKEALDFKRPGDRVRIYLPGDYESITMAAWVRVDGLDRGHNSILLTDQYDPGELHWQFDQAGDLRLGYRGVNRGVNYDAKDLVDLTQLGRWFHVATVADQKSGTVTHYLDGKRVVRSKIKNQDTLFRFGDASIGNWEAKPDDKHDLRTFNGRIAELILFQDALSAAEIRKLALQD